MQPRLHKWPLSPADRAALESDPWFSSLAFEVRQCIVRVGRLRHYSGGEPLFERGEPATEWAALCCGALRIGFSSTGAGPITVGYLPVGGWLADAAVIDGTSRVYDAEAEGDSAVLLLQREDVIDLLATHPELYPALARLHAARTALVMRIVDELKTLPLHLRIARQLARLARTHGVQDAAGGTRITLNLSQTKIAMLAGGSRQRVNAVLGRLEALALLRRGRGGLVIPSVAALYRLGLTDPPDRSAPGASRYSGRESAVLTFPRTYEPI